MIAGNNMSLPKLFRYNYHYPKRHKCSECDFATQQLVRLREHLANGHRNRCPWCPLGFNYVAALARHTLEAHGRHRYACDACEKGFDAPSALKHHLKCHRPDRERILRPITKAEVEDGGGLFECGMCAFKAKVRGSVERHRSRTHYSETGAKVS